MNNRFAIFCREYCSWQVGNTLAALEYLDGSQVARLELEDSWTSPDGKVYQIVLEDPPEGSEFPSHIQGYLGVLEGKFPVLKENRPVLFSIGRLLKVLIPDWGRTSWGAFDHYLSQMRELAVGTPEEQIRGLLGWMDYILPTVQVLEDQEPVTQEQTGLRETDGRKAWVGEVIDDSEDDQDMVETEEGRDFNRPQFDNFTLKIIHDGVETPDWVMTQPSWYNKLYCQLGRCESFRELYILTIPYRDGTEKFDNAIQARVIWDLYDTMFTRLINKFHSHYMRMRNLDREAALKQLNDLLKSSAMFRKTAKERQIHMKKAQYSYYWAVYDRCFRHLLEMAGTKQLVENCIARVQSSKDKYSLGLFARVLHQSQQKGRFTRTEAGPIWRAYYAKKKTFAPDDSNQPEDPAYVSEVAW